MYYATPYHFIALFAIISKNGIISASPAYTYLTLNSNELRILNRCSYTIWPAIVSYAGSELLENGGFELEPFETKTLPIHGRWSGKIWARTGCYYSHDRCLFLCETGDCGNGLCCGNSTGLPPITIAEIAFGTGQDDYLDRYSISLVEGYNIQMQIRPIEGGHTKETNKRLDCNLAGCFKDLNSICPEHLTFRTRKGGVVSGCQNPCLKYKASNCTAVIGNNDKGSDDETFLYESCTRYPFAWNFASLAKESCPNVLVYEHQICEGVVYTCKKNFQGFSAYELIFCP